MEKIDRNAPNSAGDTTENPLMNNKAEATQDKLDALSREFFEDSKSRPTQPPPLTAKNSINQDVVDQGNPESTIEYELELINRFDLDSLEIDDIFSLIDILEGQPSELVKKELATLLNSTPFKESLLSLLKSSSDLPQTVSILSKLIKLPFTDTSNLKDQLNLYLNEIIQSLPISMNKLGDKDILAMGGLTLINQTKSNGLASKEHGCSICLGLYSRYFFLLQQRVMKNEVVISTGNSSFNCKINVDGSVVIKNLEFFSDHEGNIQIKNNYKATFKNKEDAALFLSIKKQPNNNELLQSFTFCIVPTGEPTLNEFNEDLKYTTSFNPNNCTFGDLEKISEVINRVTQYFGYHPGWQDQLAQILIAKASYAYNSRTFSEDLKTLVNEIDPIRVIHCMQTLQKLHFNDSIKSLFHSTEITSCARLFARREITEDGVSQVDFSDAELGVGVGMANYCCGSMAVARLVALMRKTGSNLNGILKDGVIRHLKLPPEQMKNHTPASMILNKTINPEILDIGPTIRGDEMLVNEIGYNRYQKFLDQIPLGSSGLLLIDTYFLMCAVDINGSVEIFDSHGSSIPLLVGFKNPAYHAIFETKEMAGAYLSVHRKTYPYSPPFSFYPVTIKPS